MASGKVCSVCHSGYRTWGEHASSEGHRAKAYRLHDPHVGGKQHKALARDAAYRRARRVERAPEGRPIRVRAYRRGAPGPGDRPTVAVVKHRRGRPFVHVKERRLDARGRMVETHYSVAGRVLRRRVLKRA